MITGMLLLVKLLLVIQPSMSVSANFQSSMAQPCLKVISPIATLSTIHTQLDFQFALQCPLPVEIENDKPPTVMYCVALTAQADPFQQCFNDSTTLAVDTSSGWLFYDSNVNKEKDHCADVDILSPIEQCSLKPTFTIVGFKSNTFAITAFIKVISAKSDTLKRSFYTTALLDTNNPSTALPSFDNSLYGLIERFPKLYNQSYFLENVLGSSSVEAIGINGNSNMKNFFHVNNQTSLFNRLKRYPRLPISDTQPLAILIYLKEMQRHGANNRLLNWACGLSSYATKFSSPLKVSILTSDVDGTNSEDLLNYLSNECKVTVYFSDALSVPHVEKILEQQQFTKESLELIAWLSSFHVLLLTNSNGEKQTDMLLMNYLPRCTTVPIVLVDASNPMVPEHWLDFVDAVVAPSKAASLYNPMPIWDRHDIPFGVIYSSLSEDWIRSSSCWQSKTTDNDQNTNMNNMISMTYIGRLAVEKSPGILLKAIAVLLKTDTSILVETFPSISSVTEVIEDFRKRFHLNIIGDGPLRQSIVNFIELHNMTKCISLFGDLPPMSTQSHLHNTLAVVNPGIYGETYGLVHIEALTMGKPSIAFDLGGTKESLHAGILIDHFNREENRVLHRDPIYSLAEAILVMFASHDQFERQGDQICEIAKNVFENSLSLDSYVESFLGIVSFLTSS